MLKNLIGNIQQKKHSRFMKNKKIALIFGITGQDGSYLTKLLIKKGYEVFGVSRKKKIINNFKKLKIEKNKVKIFYINKINQEKIQSVIKKSKCNKIFYLSGITNVGYSFDHSYKTISYNIKYIFYILESCKNINQRVKIYNSLSSECFGNHNKLINEQSSFNPISPYGLSKSISYYLIKYYKQTHNIWISNGFVFNHESPLRTNKFVIKKIVNSVKLISLHKLDKISIGDLSIKRDWGWAPEFVKFIYKISELKKPADFIIATGKTTTLKNVLFYLFKILKIKPKNKVDINKKLFRQFEIKKNNADISKLKKTFKDYPKITIFKILEKMNSNIYY